MNLDTFVLNPPAMLADAIARHQREHFGRTPLRFHLHPRVVAALVECAETWQLTRTAANVQRFCGVEIRSDTLAFEPMMLNTLHQFVAL
jgi:hypothetical protein